MKKKVLIILSVILALIGLRFVFSSYGQFMRQKMMMAGATPKVSLSEIKEASVVRQLEAPGRIVSKYRVDVLARIDGYLTKSYFKEGDFVKKGQVLFQIEPQEWQYDVEKAKGNVANTKAQLIYAEKQLKRGAILVKKDYIAKAAYDELVSSRDALRAQLSMYQADLRDAMRNYSYTRVKAPVDGQVGIISVTVGNFVNQSAGALTTIYSIDPVYVEFPIDSKEYMMFSNTDNVEIKRKVTLTFANGQKYEQTGLQDFHDNKVDPTTGTLTMRATFPNKGGKLINGDYVKIMLYANKPTNVPVVPQTAVLENPQGKYVYKLDGNIPKITFIKTSGQSGNNWIVESGINVGDKIITGGLQQVIPNQPVKVVDEKELKNKKEEKEKK